MHGTQMRSLDSRGHLYICMYRQELHLLTRTHARARAHTHTHTRQHIRNRRVVRTWTGDVFTTCHGIASGRGTQQRHASCHYAPRLAAARRNLNVLNPHCCKANSTYHMCSNDSMPWSICLGKQADVSGASGRVS